MMYLDPNYPPSVGLISTQIKWQNGPVKNKKKNLYCGGLVRYMLNLVLIQWQNVVYADALKVKAGSISSYKCVTDDYHIIFQCWVNNRKKGAHKTLLKPSFVKFSADNI